MVSNATRSSERLLPVKFGQALHPERLLPVKFGQALRPERLLPVKKGQALCSGISGRRFRHETTKGLCNTVALFVLFFFIALCIPRSVQAQSDIYATGLDFLRLCQYRDAKLHFLEIVENDASDVLALIYLARSYFKMNLPEEAAEHYGQALLLEPTNSTALLGKGRALFRLRHNSEALEYLEQVINQLPGSIEDLTSDEIQKKEEALRFTAHTWHNLGEPEKAMEHYYQALELLPDTQNSLVWLGRTYYDLGEYDQALEYLLRANELQLSDLNTLTFLGETYEKLEDYSNAVRYFQYYTNRRVESRILLKLIKYAEGKQLQSNLILYNARFPKEFRHLIMAAIDRALNQDYLAARQISLSINSPSGRKALLLSATIGIAVLVILNGFIMAATLWRMTYKRRQNPDFLAKFPDVILSLVLWSVLAFSAGTAALFLPLIVRSRLLDRFADVFVQASSIYSSDIAMIVAIWFFLLLGRAGTVREKTLLLPEKPLKLLKYFLAGMLLYIPAISIFRFLPHNENAAIYSLLEDGRVFIFFAIGAILIAPFTEEIFYRSFIYSAIREKWSAAATITLVTLLFASMHIPQTQCLAAFIAISSTSVFLCLAREKNSSILPAIAMHMGYNLVVVTAAGITTYLV